MPGIWQILIVERVLEAGRRSVRISPRRKVRCRDGQGISTEPAKFQPLQSGYQIKGAGERPCYLCRDLQPCTLECRELAEEIKMTETFQGRTIVGRGDAESLAIQVLNFIVADVDRIIQFLNITGLQPETIRESATSSHFLLGVLEYVAKDDDLLKAIDQEAEIRPAAILV